MLATVSNGSNARERIVRASHAMQRLVVQRQQGIGEECIGSRAPEGLGISLRRGSQGLGEECTGGIGWVRVALGRRGMTGIAVVWSVAAAASSNGLVLQELADSGSSGWSWIVQQVKLRKVLVRRVMERQQWRA